MRKTLAFLVFAFISIGIYAQDQNTDFERSYKALDFEIRDLSGFWTNGMDLWSGEMVDNSVHLENAYREDCNFIQVDDVKYEFNIPNDIWLPAMYFEINDDGDSKQFMVVFTQEDVPKRIFQRIQDYRDVATMPLAPMYGTYVDELGREAVIGSERISLPDIDGVYSLHWVFETAEPVAMVYPEGFLGHGEYTPLYLQITLAGVDVFEAVNEDFEGLATDSTPGKLLYRLKYNSPIPRWMPMVCDSLVPDEMLNFVPKDILGVMRNLPYALRGYKFGKPLYKEYFESQPWYTPAESNADIAVSQIESINGALIRNLEKNRD